jgi:D-amino peptidase
MDCHGAGKGWTFNSLVPELLDPRCDFVVQEEWTEYTDFLEQGCDAALLVGMHAMAGTPDGVLNHTVSGTGWRSLAFNGTVVGETGINAALCGTWGCPVLLVTGDEAVCRESRALLGDGLGTVAVKQGLGRFSARHIAPLRARALIEAAASSALSDLGAVTPYSPGSPCEIRIELATSDAVERYRHHPVVEVLDGRTLVSSAGDWWSAWRQFYFTFFRAA